MENILEDAFALLSDEVESLAWPSTIDRLDACQNQIDPLSFYRDYVAQGTPILFLIGKKLV